MRKVWIGLGANLGDARQTLKAALQDLSGWALETSGTQAGFQAASLYRSESVGAPGPDYLNTVAQFSSALPATAILRHLLSVEQAFGRTRPYHHAPRVLDLDLLMAGEERIHSPFLTLPHPRMLVRAFVLMPMAELAPDLVLEGRPIAEHLQACLGQRCVRIPESD